MREAILAALLLATAACAGADPPPRRRRLHGRKLRPRRAARQDRADPDGAEHRLPQRRGARGGEPADPGRRADEPDLSPPALGRESDHPRRDRAKPASAKGGFCSTCSTSISGRGTRSPRTIPSTAARRCRRARASIPSDLTKDAVRRLSRRPSGREGGADQRLYGGEAAGRPAGRGALQRRISAVARAGGETARAGGGADEQRLAARSS